MVVSLNVYMSYLLCNFVIRVFGEVVIKKPLKTGKLQNLFVILHLRTILGMLRSVPA